MSAPRESGERIVFLERNSLVAKVRRPAFPHTWREHDGAGDEDPVERLADATIAIVNKTPMGAGVLGRLPALRMIAVAATGTDNVDVAACRERGIVVANVRGYAAHTVAEHTFALILALRRSLFAYRQDVARGLWQQSARFCLSGHPVRDLHGSTLGLFGEGAIGQAVARIAQGFGMRVLFADHAPPKVEGVEFVAPQAVLVQSDIVSLHMPLTPATRGMIGARELAAMRPGALLINTSRGGLVDEEALAQALRGGHLGGAGFDVLCEEPPRRGSPLLAPDLGSLIVTPHVAWSGEQAMQALADQLIDNIEAFARGAPRNVVAA